MVARLRIRTELSAQRMLAAPNPLIHEAIDALKQRRPSLDRIVDLGCGKLRHLTVLLNAFDSVVLVDTIEQLSRSTVLAGRRTTVLEYVASHPERERLTVVSADQFEKEKAGYPAILSVATLDVLPSRPRIRMVRAAFSNLQTHGLCCVIVPRNDSSILRRCLPERRYDDGYRFEHHGAATFYRNFRDIADLADTLESVGFEVVQDFSRYRQAALIATRP